MAIKNILVPLVGRARDAAVLDYAMAAGKPFAAHIRALFVRPDATQTVLFFGDEMVPGAAHQIMEATRAAADAACAAAHKTVVAAAGVAGLRLVEGMEPGGTVSFAQAQGLFADCVTRASQLADLVVFGLSNGDDRPELNEAFEAVLLEAGRPVLLCAQTPSGTLAARVAVGWNDSIASAHALNAALPYLAVAQDVEVLTIRRDEEEPVSSDDVLAYLRLHGVSARVRVVDCGGRRIGKALLETAAEGGASMLVLGGYGHSRLREMFTSGVTRHVVGQASLPLFLVH